MEEKGYYYVVIWESVNLEQQYNGEFGTKVDIKISSGKEYEHFSKEVKKIIINNNMQHYNIDNIRFLSINLMNP